MSTALLLSDVHLTPDLPRCTAGFKALLGGLPKSCSAVYMLGDLFEAWVGDDNHHPYFDQIRITFRAITTRGISLYLCHGNRDFLLSRGPVGTPPFADQVGARMLQDAEVVALAGQPTLLMHGDQLCTLDQAYMAFRQQSRNEAWQQQMLEKSLDQRIMVADFWRMQSKAANANKAENIMDVTPDEVLRVMSEAGVHTLLHGHTHRPQRHALTLPDGSAGERIVLGDWREDEGSAVIAWADADGIRLETWRF